MWISTAYAQGVGSLLDNQGALLQFMPLVLIFVVFYFLLIRPQQQKAKQHRATLDALRRGDRVVTGGRGWSPRAPPARSLALWTGASSGWRTSTA